VLLDCGRLLWTASASASASVSARSSPLSACHRTEVVDIQIVDQPVRLGELRRVVADKR
jgi:hypothetical protein